MGTITKALTLLNHFSASRPEIGLTEFRKLSGQDKATVHRHLVELAANGFLEQNPGTKGYRLGPAILRLAAVRERLFPARTLVAPLVEQLAADLGELVHVSLREGDHMSPLYHYDALIHGTRVYFDEAELLPLHATASGLAMLAFGPDRLLADLLKAPLKAWTRHSITNPKQLKDSVDRVREDGIAYVDQGFEDHVSSFAAPVFGDRLEAIGTIAVAAPTVRMTEDLKSRIRRDLPRTASEVTDKLGGLVPTDLKRIWHNVA
ncbi:IclR family transcriptional regulator [Roseibium sediminicola]|uniref:IclR family transcriptional regulator n=1 Tax=Roseibium sediminicola TaxID=2933272 RepID=A0ABT0H022_9HYPH|nr:IclR family transcriptional regulator [Roseibium sp. CAU 1639]MCK7615036.1 IclR family transcriptional regulator [Roseibium sp. CAU 1639]